MQLGIGYEDRSKNDWVEMSNKHEKRLNQKSIQENRKASCSKLLNNTSKRNKTSKTNKPGEKITLKREKRSI